jgi:hypothetical protein
MANAATGFPPSQACPSDPSADRNAAALPNLAPVLRIVAILLSYGRHLADTFDRRAAAPGFHLIARHFGTGNAAVILAHIRRGILRAAALHHVLLQRAATGRDLTRPPYRVRLRPQAPPPADPAASPAAAAADAAASPAAAADPAAPPAADPAAQPEPAADPAAQPEPTEPGQTPRPAPHRSPRPAWRDGWLDGAADPLDPRHLPSFQELVKQARRRPFGRSIGDICADLGIAPRLCQGRFWTDLLMTMMTYNGSPAVYDLRRWRREQVFEQDQDRNPTMDLLWPPVDVGGGRRDILHVMGFLIGEPPLEPLALPPEAPPAHAATPAPAPAAPLATPATPAPPATPATRARLAAPAAPAALRPQAAWVIPPAPRSPAAPTGPP